ncbi:MAG: valine--tRNA ligase [bacterium]|nr:valine--tRNA ligase [bacterium]
MESSNELPKAYEPQNVENRTYKAWLDSGLFNPDAYPEAKNPFCIIMPPPNATGRLHTGHALGYVLEDLMTRYHRMKGDKTLWLPGTDHASIASTNKVEKLLAKEGISRHDLGREKFLERVSQYVEQSRSDISNQGRLLGASCDWSRERYTLEPAMTKAVRTMFARMYKDDLIYRGTRIVNWCPRCMSTLADDEVNHKDQEGILYYIKYPIKNSEAFLTVATTRPETMLGDVAVAVNPNDPRYQQYIGNVVTLPLANRDIPVIADEYVDMEFGTGSLKITPAHDPNDFEIGRKYNLPTYRILDDEAKINFDSLRKANHDLSSIQQFEGMDRYTAREAVISALQTAGLFEKKKTYSNSVGVCYRCDTIIEPITSLQWFIDVNKKTPRHNESLKEMGLRAIHSKDIQIIPQRFEKQYFQWTENLRDWCISRQIWFGHQIPVSYCLPENGGCGETIVSVEEPLQCPKCSNTKPTPEEDTLDTWFSSGMWTFSTMGWPDNAEEKDGKIIKKGDLATFHPTTVLDTMWDILTFWVNRMILMTEYALDEAPFKTIYLHGMVLDKNGRKMSKSHEETAIDPLEMIEKYGTDALRLSLLIGVTPGNSMRLSQDKVESYRNFVNKLWNISRYILTFTGNEEKSEKTAKKPQYTLADRWIISRLNNLIAEVSKSIEHYEFSHAAELLRVFTWDDFADWYVEISKVEGDKRALLLSILEVLLVLWHPMAPFVTEEIYRLALSSFPPTHPDRPALLMVRAWPQSNSSAIDEKIEQEFLSLQKIVQTIRNARSENHISAGEKINLIFYTPHKSAFLTPHIDTITRLTHAGQLTIQDSGKKPHSALFLTTEDIEIYIPLTSMKIEEEKTRLDKEIINIESLIGKTNGQLANQEFVAKAPEHIVQDLHQKVANYQDELVRMQEQRKRLI